MTLKFAYFCKDHRPALAQLKAQFEVSMLSLSTSSACCYALCWRCRPLRCFCCCSTFRGGEAPLVSEPSET